MQKTSRNNEESRTPTPAQLREIGEKGGETKGIQPNLFAADYPLECFVYEQSDSSLIALFEAEWRYRESDTYYYDVVLHFVNDSTITTTTAKELQPHSLTTIRQCKN